MAPSSYQPPTRGDKAAASTRSQSVESNLSQTHTTVAKLLAKAKAMRYFRCGRAKPSIR